MLDRVALPPATTRVVNDATVAGPRPATVGR